MNSVCHEFETNPQLKSERNEHAMKSHTCRINRGVRGAEGSFETAFKVESVKVPALRWISVTCSKTPNGDVSLVIRHGPRPL